MPFFIVLLLCIQLFGYPAASVQKLNSVFSVQRLNI